MGKYDFFAVERDDNTTTTSPSTNPTASGGSFVLAAEGNNVSVSSSTGFVLDEVVRLSDSPRPLAYCRVTKIDSGGANRLYLLPIQSTADGAGAIGSTYSTATIISAYWQPHLALPIDLSDAPDPTYRYLVCMAAGVTSDTASKAFNAGVFSRGFVDDPISSVVVGLPAAQMTCTSGSGVDLYQYQAISAFTLKGGQRNYFRLSTLANANGQTVTTFAGRACAMRLDLTQTFYEGGSGVGTGTTNATATDSSGEDPDSKITGIPAGDYLVFASARVSNNTGGGTARVRLKTGGGGGTIWAAYSPKPVATTDQIMYSWVGVVTAAASDTIAWYIAAPGAVGTSTVDRSYICILPATLVGGHYVCPALAGGVTVDTDSAAGPVNAPDTDTTYSDTSVSANQILTAGIHVEFISAVLSNSAASGARAEPKFGSTLLASPTSRGEVGWVQNGGTGQGSLFTFIRNKRAGGTTEKNTIMTRTISGTGTPNLTQISYVWIREQAAIAPALDTPCAVVADVESGLCMKQWASASGTDCFQKLLPSVSLVSRVLRGGPDTATSGAKELAKQATSTLSAADQWFWDPASHTIKVRLPSGKTPADVDQTVVVVALSTYGRSQADLVDSDAVTRPYEGRLTRVPTITSELQVRSEGAKSSTTLGSLDITAGNVDLDNLSVQRIYEGLRTKVVKGWPSLSSELSDFLPVLTGTMAMPRLAKDTLSLNLFDRVVNLGRPISTVRFTQIYTGDTAVADRLEPVIYGTVRRCPAYRTTNNAGAGQTNTFQVAAHAVKAMTGWNGSTDVTTRAYLNGTDVTAVVVVNSQNLTAATFVVRQADEATNYRADTLYVDVQGMCTDGPAASSGALLSKPGEIMSHLSRTYAGLADDTSSPQGDDFVMPTFRLLDRRWRRTYSGGTFIPTGVKVGLYVDDSKKVSEGLDEICRQVFAYWAINRVNRMFVGVPDLEKANLLLDNPGIEYDSASIWPYYTVNSASASISASPHYDGMQALQVSNGSNASAAVRAVVIFPRPGTYVLTCMASLQTGDGAHCTLGVIPPNDGLTELISDPFTLSSTGWTRLSFPVTLKQGDAGTGVISIYPAKGVTTATSINIDNIELVPVAAIAEDTSADPLPLEFRDENFFEGRVTYSVNLQAQDQAPAIIVTDVEARGLGTTVSEAKNAIQTTSRVDLGNALLADAPSAAGVAASLAAYFGRMRHVLHVVINGLTEIPKIGERIYHQLATRIPQTADAYPLWLVTKVSTVGDFAHQVQIECERQTDPVIDRIDIAPSDIPLGAIVFSTAASITGYSEVTELQDMFVAGAATSDLATERGNYYHQHALAHTHPLGSHTHTYTPGAPGSITTGFEQQLRQAVGGFISFARGQTSGGHTHSGLGASQTSGTPSTANSASTSPTSLVGPNEPSFYRGKWMKRTGGSGNIPQDVILGYESATIPAGWSRVTALDGKFLRGATARGAIATTVKTSTYTVTNAGSTLILNADANVHIGKRLVVGASPKNAVIVTAGSGGAGGWTVVPLYETGDGNPGQTYAVGVAVAGDSEAQGQTFTAPNHRHGGTGNVPSHTHTAPHSHAGTSQTTGTASDTVLGERNGPFGAYLDHTHAFQAAFPLEASSSTAATGDITQDKIVAPWARKLVWIQPADALQSVIPAGVIALFDSVSLPSGWVRYGAADGLLLGGAAAASPASTDTAGHTHDFTAAAHTLTNHTHGTNYTDTTGAVSSGAFQNTQKGSGGDPYSSVDHWHSVAVTGIQQQSPSLSSTSTTSAAAVGDSIAPRYRTLVLGKKL